MTYTKDDLIRACLAIFREMNYENCAAQRPISIKAISAYSGVPDWILFDVLDYLEMSGHVTKSIGDIFYVLKYNVL